MLTELIEVTRLPTDADRLATAMPAACATTGAPALKPLNPTVVHCACAEDPAPIKTTNAPAPRSKCLMAGTLVDTIDQVPTRSTLPFLIIQIPEIHG